MIRIRTLREFIWQVAEQFGEAEAYVWTENGEIRSKSYIDLNEDVTRIARELHYRFDEQRHIALIGDTSYAWLSTFFGIVVSSNIAVPMDVKSQPKEIIDRLKYSDTSIVMLSNKYAGLKEEILRSCPKVKKVFTLENFMNHMSDASEKDTLSIAYPDQVSLMLFTSGTTGDGFKAAMITQDGILSIAKSYVPGFRPGDHVLSLLPVHHCIELCNGQLKALYNGCTIYINDSIANIMQNIIRFKINSFVCVPMVANMLCAFIERESKTKTFEEIKQILGGNLQRLVTGGAAINAKMIELLSKIDVIAYNGYGLTESTGGCIYNFEPRQNPESCGIPYANGLEFKIADDGEILLKGPCIMSGYYKQPDLTERTLEHGWLHTGDLAKQKDNGYLVILGRKDNLINLANGEKVYPEELEDKINKIPYVTAVMVYAVNNHLSAMILPAKADADILNSITNAVNDLNGNLPGHMKITDVIFRDKPFPTTSSMKIKRSLVMKELEEGMAKKTKEYVPPENDEQAAILEKVRQVLPNADRISITENLYDLGLDSLSTVELSIYLECSPALIYECKTVKNLADKLENSDDHANLKMEGINEIIEHTNQHSALKKNAAVLVTGAAGFLGSHLVSALLERNDKVIVLVRDKDKLEKAYSYYGVDSSKADVVVGDITKDKLGLSDTVYNRLCQEVDAVFHTAATVSHVGDVSYSYEVNVKGTEEVIHFCREADAQLYHMSSYAVTGFNSDRSLTEKVLDIGQQIHQNPYIQTKYQAEEQVLKARENGVQSTIFRIGNLTKRSSDGVFQMNADSNGMSAQIRAFNKLNVYPVSMKKAMYDDTSVDKAAEAIALLADGHGTGHIWHIMNPDAKTIREVSGANEVSDEEFDSILTNNHDIDVNILSIYYKMAKEGFNTNFDPSFTVNILKETGFTW